VKADATHVVVAVDAAAEVVTALNAESVAKKVAASAQPAAVIEQNVVTVQSGVTAMNVAIAPSALMAPTRPTQKVARRVKNADVADVLAQLLVRAMQPTSPTCLTTPKPLAKWAVQKTPCKHKPRCAPRRATNALRVKTMVMLAKRQTEAKPLAVSAPRAVKTAATSVLAMMNLHKPKHLRACLLPKRLRLMAKQERTTTASAANAVHATDTAATAASAEVSAPIVKKVVHKNNWVLTTSLLLRPHSVVMAQELLAMRKHRMQTPQLPAQQRLAPVCLKFSTSTSLCQSCKRLHKAAVWNGSIQTRRAFRLFKRPLQQSQSPCMCHALDQILLF
jgi:hypothetical protein